MAVVYQQTIAGHHYRVVRAGASIRLYTDGIFHSQFNERTIVSGALWDLLLLPAFILEQGPERALVLGVGGGAVLRMLNRFFPTLTITGVDLNPEHLLIAERYFKVAGSSYQLLQGDAQQWLANYNRKNKKAKFDLIIDDVFGGSDGDPERPYLFDQQWLTQLLSGLSDRGVLVINFDRPGLLSSFIKQFKTQLIAAGIVLGWSWQSPGYENRILSLTKVACTTSELSARLCQHSELDTGKKSCLLNYSVRTCLTA